MKLLSYQSNAASISSQSGGARKMLIFVLALCAGAAMLTVVPWPCSRKAVEVLEVPRGGLELREGRFYQTGQTNPFTGLSYESYADGSLLSRSVISNGLLNGVSESWYTNGQRQVREHFKDGISH